MVCEVPFGGQTFDAEGLLTYHRLGVLARPLGVRWELIQPWYGSRRWSWPRIARPRGGPEAARFQLVVGRRADLS
jgi:hypothetical protein